MSESHAHANRAGSWSTRSRFVLLIVAVAAVLVGLAFWREARRERRSAHPPVEGRIELAGLNAPLLVVRDRRGVPHLRARSERDAWLGLGFVHAQDRLAQMVWLRRLAAGRSAERIGADGLASDRLSRTLDFAGLARRDFARARPEARAALEAYAAGVNAWLAQLRAGETAPPLGLLEPVARIAAWTPVDSLALAKHQAFALADPIAEILVLERVVRSLGAGPARALFPSGLGGAPPTPRLQQANAALDARAVGRLAVARDVLGLRGGSVGSAGWIVAGEGTRRGRALLAADLHFPPRMPSRVYEAHLRGGALEAAGATLPGIPGFWAGFNPDLAWALVQTPVVVADLFEETLYAEDPSRYFDGGKWRSLTLRAEHIKIAGAPDEVLTVRTTSRGPLIDGLFPEAGRPLALRWTGLLGGGIDGLIGLAHARDVGSAREALRAHTEPVEAALLVDARGAGLMQLAGAVPRREFPSGLQPVPSSNPAYEWSTRLALEELPAEVLGAGTPWLIAADAPLGTGASRIESLWLPGARAEQLRARLRAAAASGRPDLAQLVALQADQGSPVAQRSVAAVLALMAAEPTLGPEEREVLESLKHWDGISSAGSRGAAAFHVLSKRVLPMLFAPALGDDLAAAYLALPRLSAPSLLSETLASAAQGGDPEAPWTEPALVRASLARSLRETSLFLAAELGASRENWTWGRLHHLRFAPLWPGAWRGEPSELGPFELGGAGDSIAVSEYAAGGDSFDAEVVAGYRLLVDAGNLDQALTAFAPGQSEHAGHAHATDALERWRVGKPNLLSTSDPVIEDGDVRVLRLEPAP